MKDSVTIIVDVFQVNFFPLIGVKDIRVKGTNDRVGITFWSEVPCVLNRDASRTVTN